MEQVTFEKRVHATHTCYNFKPSLRFIGQMPDYSEAEIKKEPMVFSANKYFAYKMGGAITKSFVHKFLNDHDDWIIDSRVHMLMPGWYPCIPGWHHDDVPRSGANNQPNYENPEYHSEHRMVVIGGSALPEFYDAEITLPVIDNDIIYKEWNKLINHHHLKNGYIKQIPSGNVVDFMWSDFHRGTPATKNCWRFFIRASRNTHRQFHNELRTQVQVYMSALEAGW